MSNLIPHDPTPTPTPATLLALALEKGAGIDQLERLLVMQERYEANEARKAYAAALAAFKAEPLAIITKSKLVEFDTNSGTTSYRHAELADCTAALVPLLAKHGLAHRWDIRQEPGQVTVDCVLMHRDGHSERVTMAAAPDASGKKNAIQQVASTTTYLQRYTFLAITGYATTGQDDDGQDAEAAPLDPAAQAEWIRSLEACQDRRELAARRVEMIAKVGGGDVHAVPLALRDAAHRRAEQLAEHAGAEREQLGEKLRERSRGPRDTPRTTMQGA